MPSVRPIKGAKGIRWRAEVWVRGQRQSARFGTKPEAVRWALEREAELATDGRIVGGRTLGCALERYGAEVSAGHRGARAERMRIRRLLRDPVSSVALERLTAADVERYIETRSSEVQPATILRDITIVKAAVRRAVRWRWLSEYPLVGIEEPKEPRPRDRVYSTEEIRAIVAASGLPDAGPPRGQKQAVALAFLFALETAMRQGEIAGLAPEDVDLSRRVARLDKTKNGDPRDVPLSSRAVEIIRRLEPGRTLFGIDANSLSVVFTRLRRAAGVSGATFHDARRTATVRLSKKLDVLDLAKVTGHRDVRMLLRVYYRHDAEALARLLD